MMIIPKNNWLHKISDLQSNWWKNIQFHLDNTIKSILKPIKSDIGLRYEGTEPVYIPNFYNKNIVGFHSFSNNSVILQFNLWARLMRYDCFVEIEIDKSTKDQLRYNDKSKSNVYYTDTIDGFEQIQGDLTGTKCFIKRRFYDRSNPGKVDVITKEIGPVELVQQEISPFNIITTFKQMIENDWDNDGDNSDLPNDPTPIDDELEPAWHSKSSLWKTKSAQKINQDNFDDLLFHGTSETIKGELSPQSHGKILWVAENPATAQNYIPESGGKVYFPYIDDYSSDDLFSPNKGLDYDLLLQMGYDLNVQWDQTGRVSSWRMKNGGPLPRKIDVKNYIENTLKYQVDADKNVYVLKIKGNVVMPSDYRKPGTLYIFTGKDKLKLLDLTGGNSEDDLMEPTYKKIDWFEKARSAGYDGVRINDFGQSEYWGNYGHKSIGLFESGLKKLQQEKVSATNHDWSDDNRYDFNTKEYSDWKSKTRGL